ncbi:MAG: hypothetical protein V1708_01945 [Candidatus Micrarchaeota archaeon]
MANDFKKLLACFQELGFTPRVFSFEDRIKVQKLAVLLQQLNVKLGYDFNLYVRGPYSPDLAQDFFSHDVEKEKSAAKAQLDAKDAKAVGELKRCFYDGFRTSILEICGTYAFLRYGRGMPEDEAVRKLKELKPFYSEADVAVGISRAKQLFFKPTPADLEFIRRENELWDAVSAEAWAKTP